MVSGLKKVTMLFQKSQNVVKTFRRYASVDTSTFRRYASVDTSQSAVTSSNDEIRQQIPAEADVVIIGIFFLFLLFLSLLFVCLFLVCLFVCFYFQFLFVAKICMKCMYAIPSIFDILSVGFLLIE